MAFKNIRIKMKGGKSRLQRVKVLASGKYKFVKNLTKSKSRSNPRRSSPRPKTRAKTTRRRTNLTRRKRGRRSRQFTIPLAPIAGLAAGVMPAVDLAVKGDLEGAAAVLSINYTGYNPQDQSFDLMRLQRGLVPLVIGALVHKFVGGAPLNLNRMLAAANVPLIRI